MAALATALAVAAFLAPARAQDYDPGIVLNATCGPALAGTCQCSSSVEDLLPFDQMAFVIREFAREGTTWMTATQSWFDDAAAEAMVRRLERACRAAPAPASRDAAVQREARTGN